MKPTCLALLAVAVAGALAGTARADGLPIVNVDVGSSGVAGKGVAADVRFVALPVRSGTLVARIQREGGRVIGTRLLPERFTVPAVAYDGTADGLSADGRTLVLIRPRVKFPQARTTLAILDAERLRLREVVTLEGDFSFDAISPSGSWMYLIQYISPRNPTRYAVRAYDLRAGRLLPKPVVDPTEPGERMGGFPVTRAWSPDGRWAYTLYDKAGKEPFVHALDTSGRTARCIDLESLAGRQDLNELRLDLGAGGGTLTVRDGPEAVAVINTQTFRVSEPVESAGPTAAPPQGVFPWTFVAAPAAGIVLALVAVGALRLRRRPSAAASRGT
jgi:hypothetical protein